jgi:CDP-2,3-bis-(O-geranylgeranyl)-sn-glycerol synthase
MSVLTMTLLVLQTLWYFLPAAVANTAPVLARYFQLLPWLNRPLDGGRQWRERPLLGRNKTIRGFVVGIACGAFIGVAQWVAWYRAPFLLQPIVLLPQLYTSLFISLVWGAWLGCAALLGDALKSFLKRQLDILPGHPWKPWDQIDMVIGVLLCAQWIAPLSVTHIITAFVVIGVLSYVTSVIGVYLRLKKSV